MNVVGLSMVTNGETVDPDREFWSECELISIHTSIIYEAIFQFNSFPPKNVN